MKLFDVTVPEGDNVKMICKGDGAAAELVDINNFEWNVGERRIGKVVF